MEIHISVLSKLGGRERNEDACGYWSDGGPICCVLSDGAGGHGGGDVASRIAVETVLRQFSVAPGCSPGMVFSLIDQANRDVISQQGNSNDTGSREGIGVFMRSARRISQIDLGFVGYG